MNTPPVFFDDALKKAHALAVKWQAIFTEIRLLRDFRGRIRILLPHKEEEYLQQQEKLACIDQEWGEQLDAYAPPPKQRILFAGSLLQGQELLQSEEWTLFPNPYDDVPVPLLERQISGQDWAQPPLQRKTQTPWVSFYGVKGGVGRSTTLAIWAWHLASKGKKVLILDLDLESPGVSNTLLPDNFLPDYGIIDWFMEDGVGQAQHLSLQMTSTSPLSRDLAGEIRVVPTGGRATEEYLAKLSRCYTGTQGQSETWAQRLLRLIESLEEQEKPDIVLLDSRAGLHDIAAVLVTRLGAYALLFGMNTQQTWKAYELLFQNWWSHPHLRQFREKLQMVATQIPETGTAKSVDEFTEKSWDIFIKYIYDEVKNDYEGFSFARAEEAPHTPFCILWSRALQEFSPLSDFDTEQARLALRDFITKADALILSEGNK